MRIRAWSVRNCGKICLAHGVCYAMRRRPPRGGRGLKQLGHHVCVGLTGVAPRAGGVD